MVKVFSHWICLRTICQMAADVVFPVAFLLLVVGPLGIVGPGSAKIVTVYAAIYAVVVVVLNGWLGLYNWEHQRTMVQTRARAVLTIFLSIPSAYLIFHFLKITDATHDQLLLVSLIALFVTLAHRVYSLHKQGASLLAQRVLIFGGAPEARSLSEALVGTSREINIVGYYPSFLDATGVAGAKAPTQHKDRSLLETARALNVDDIVVAVQERRGGVLPLRELLDCKLSGINVLDLASYFERTFGQIRLESLYAGWLIFGDGFRQGRLRTFDKRVFDIVAALILIVCSLPVVLLAAILIALEDGFPIFYSQDRVGRGGRIFKVIKFRSMRKDAESDGKPRWATADDDRTTRVGRIIRKTRIDELPQLYTVLIGDMSLVGPRPERPFFVDQLAHEIPFYAVRHSVKPGVTGWAQVKYHYGASVDDSRQKLQYDLYYVKNHTLFLDIVILFKTVGVVLSGAGAR